MTSGAIRRSRVRMYRLQAKLLALAIVASGAELGTNDRGLSNASDEVQGLLWEHARGRPALEKCVSHAPRERDAGPVEERAAA